MFPPDEIHVESIRRDVPEHERDRRGARKQSVVRRANDADQDRDADDADDERDRLAEDQIHASEKNLLSELSHRIRSEA